MESVGSHDDLAMAIALANWATKEFRGSVILLDDDLPGFDKWFLDSPGKGAQRMTGDDWFVA